MIGRTNANAGGGGNTFAFIVVTYPEGSVCTCSDGTRTIRAKGTTGSFAFNIPYSGRWKVFCENKTTEQQAESDYIDINNCGESKTVILNYDICLYEYGHELSEWGTQNSQVSKETDRMTLSVSGGNTSVYYSKAAKYHFSQNAKTLHATFIGRRVSAGNTFAALFIRDSVPTMGNIGPHDQDLVSSINFALNENITLDLDISSYAGMDKYVCFGIRYNGAVELLRVWVN